MGMIQLRPAAYDKLKLLTAELSRQAGWKLSMTAVVEMALDQVERIEAMKNEDDVLGYREKEAEQLRQYTRT